MTNKIISRHIVIETNAVRQNVKKQEAKSELITIPKQCLTSAGGVQIGDYSWLLSTMNSGLWMHCMKIDGTQESGV